MLRRNPIHIMLYRKYAYIGITTKIHMHAHNDIVAPLWECSVLHEPCCIMEGSVRVPSQKLAHSMSQAKPCITVSQKV